MANILKILSRTSPTTIALSDYVGSHGEFILDPDTGQILYHDGSTIGGTPIGSGGGGDGSLEGFTSGIVTEAPNDSVNLSVLAATGGGTDDNQSITILASGLGAFMLSLPTNDSTGGNARGQWAVDLQLFASGKQSPTQVASGVGCFAAGGNNTSSGLFSSVVGFGNISSNIGSHAEGQSTTSSNVATHAEGQGTAATSSYAHAEGLDTVASGEASHAGGNSCQASGDNSFAHGVNTLADANASYATGQDSMTRGTQWYQVYSTGDFATQGDNQTGRLRLKGFTGNNTPTPLTSDGQVPTGNNQVSLQASSLLAVDGTVAARDFVANNAMFTFTALLKCDSSGVVAVVGSPTVTQLYADTGAETWTVTIAADEVNVALQVNAIGANGVDIRWTVELRVQELVY